MRQNARNLTSGCCPARTWSVAPGSLRLWWDRRHPAGSGGTAGILPALVGPPASCRLWWANVSRRRHIGILTGDMQGVANPIRVVVLVTVTRALLVISPVYDLGASEDEVRALACPTSGH